MGIINYIGTAIWNTVLFLLLGIFPWIAVAFIMQMLSNSIRKSLAKILGIQGYIYLNCPGVMVHEIGHALFCIIFRHKIIEMKLFSPKADGTLGYVNHSYNPNNFYQRIGNFFIGTGPVWFGFIVLYFISQQLLPNGMNISDFISANFWGRWQSYVWLYLSLTIASHITLSRPDLAGSTDGVIAILAVALSCFLLFGWCGEWENTVIDFFMQLAFSFVSFFSFFIVLLLIFSIICRMLVWRK